VAVPRGLRAGGKALWSGVTDLHPELNPEQFAP